MLPSLPPEILDLVVKYLHDERTVLNACSTVSKSWVPRARRYLFFRIEFSPESPIELWIRTFPVPSSSPAHHARTLSFHDFTIVAAAVTHARPWINAFHHIVHLQMKDVQWDDDPSQVSLVPFQGSFPILKSLSLKRCYIPAPEALSFICSFPILKDLDLGLFFASDETAIDEWNPPSISPEPTGTLHLAGKIRPVIPRLLNLPNFFRFSEITIVFDVHDVNLANDLVLKCSDSLESLSIGYFLPTLDPDDGESLPPLDLSKATTLMKLAFQLHRDMPDVQWVSATLRTTKSQSLRQIDIYSRISSFDPIEEAVLQGWWDLDHLLAKLWTSHSIRPEIIYS